MRKTILAASVAIAALSLPAFAQDHGHGGGGGGGIDHVPAGPPTTIPASPNANERASGQVTGDVHAQTDSHASDRAQTRTGANVDRSTRTDVDTTTTTTRTDADRDGDDDDRAATGAGDIVKNQPANKFGGAACAPALAGRDPACVPPGQANKTFRVGQHLSSKYKYFTEFGSIPQPARSQVPPQYQTNDYRFIYQTDRIYVVNRDTNTVASVINLAG